MRLLFMGTPHFVIPVLQTLENLPQSQVVGVYTSPDRPRGRGRATEPTPVKQHALQQGLPVFQPPTLRSPEAQTALAALEPDAIVVAAYGRFLPPPVLELPPQGCLNLHPSLLPQFRGPSPVVTAIRDGLTATGITLMLLDEGMDTGPILAQKEHPIAPSDTAESLTAALFAAGTDLLVETLPRWNANQIEPRPQDNALATETRKIERSDGEADWCLSARELELRQRAYTPWPGLFTHWNAQLLKLLGVSVLDCPPGLPARPGSIVVLPYEETPVAIKTGDGLLGLQSVQLEGRRPATARDFLQGYPSFIGSRL